MPKLPTYMIHRKGRPGYYYRKREGNRVVQVALGTDYEEACRKLRQLLKSEGPVRSLRVRDAATRWLEGYVKTARNAKGQKLAKRRVESYLTPRLGHLLVTRLTREHLREYRIFLETQPISVQTVAHVLSDARCFLGWCEDAGLVERSPFPRKLLPRIQERPPDRLAEEETARACALPGHWGFVARLGFETGLRWSELCRAQSTDVSPQGELVVSRTKTGRVRRVPLSPELLREIRGKVGRLVPYSPRSSGAFAQVVRGHAGVARFHPHQMRHTFACRWLEAGGSLAALQQVLGHSTIVTTQRYARLTDEAVRREAGKVARVIAGER